MIRSNIMIVKSSLRRDRRHFSVIKRRDGRFYTLLPWIQAAVAIPRSPESKCAALHATPAVGRPGQIAPALLIRILPGSTMTRLPGSRLHQATT
jgi:hypothetical protein